MELKKIRPEDIKKLAELEKLCFSQPWSEKALAEEVDNPQAYFVVAWVQDRIAGYAGMHCAPGACYMDNVAVFPQFRRQGVGEKLVCALEEEALRQNAELLSLEVRPSNEPAVRLYTRLGFLEVGRRKDFYQNPLEDALILTHFFRKG